MSNISSNRAPPIASPNSAAHTHRALEPRVGNHQPLRADQLGDEAVLGRCLRCGTETHHRQGNRMQTSEQVATPATLTPSIADITRPLAKASASGPTNGASATQLTMKPSLSSGDHQPIASLDPASSRRVMEQLAALACDSGVTVLVSLHQTHCPRTIALRGGEVVFNGPTTALTAQRLVDLYGAQTEELLSSPHADPAPARRPVPTLPALQAA